MKGEKASKKSRSGEEEPSVKDDKHPSRNLGPRAKGYGIGGGYERPYRERAAPNVRERETYGPVPHSGYYGSGAGQERFERGQAGYNDELSWYGAQYGESTSGQVKKKS